MHRASERATERATDIITGIRNGFLHRSMCVWFDGFVLVCLRLHRAAFLLDQERASVDSVSAATASMAAIQMQEWLKYVKAIILIAIPPSSRRIDPILEWYHICVLQPSLHLWLLNGKCDNLCTHTLRASVAAAASFVSQNNTTISIVHQALARNINNFAR